ncbi:hypothetical protein [Nocardia transvalensis]|uniref:hypothetical protein n=1 Tax=Nocardia transvalensis TaxID=37333 RepID=UPI001894F8F2|nr:hypothetical protein [Nocardia transvalensis]MBF6333711.1 hypothetical protein [Nocardia transvalensis]
MTAQRLIIGGGVAIGAMAALLGAGSASAAEFEVDPAEGYAGVYLSHDDTVLLANTPVPDWLDQIATPDNTYVVSAPYTRYQRIEGPDDEGWIVATPADLWREAATQPDGSVSVYWLDPARYEGYSFEVRQE